MNERCNKCYWPLDYSKGKTCAVCLSQEIYSLKSQLEQILRERDSLEKKYKNAEERLIKIKKHIKNAKVISDKRILISRHLNKALKEMK